MIKEKFSEDDLLLVLKKKDLAGFKILYRMYSPALFGIICDIIKQRDVAEEVLQTTFLKIWAGSERYDLDKGRIFTWMLNIARNSAIDKLRSKEYKDFMKNVCLADHISSVDEKRTSSINVDTIDLRKMVSRLDPKLKDVLELVYFQGFTHIDASERLSIPIGTVKTRIRYALQELRQQFD